MGFHSWLDFLKDLVYRVHKFHVVVMCALRFVCFELEPSHFIFQDAGLRPLNEPTLGLFCDICFIRKFTVFFDVLNPLNGLRRKISCFL